MTIDLRRAGEKDRGSAWSKPMRPAPIPLQDLKEKQRTADYTCDLLSP